MVFYEPSVGCYKGLVKYFDLVGRKSDGPTPEILLANAANLHFTDLLCA